MKAIDIFCIIGLMAPIFIEWWEDRNGDKHPNNDWAFRFVIMVIVSFGVELFHPTKNFFQAFALSFSMFAFFFPYGMNIIHYKNKVIIDHRWWDYLNDTAFPDKWPMWKGLHWSNRMIMLSLLLISGILIYNCWGKLFSFYNEC